MSGVCDMYRYRNKILNLSGTELTMVSSDLLQSCICRCKTVTDPELIRHWTYLETELFHYWTCQDSICPKACCEGWRSSWAGRGRGGWGSPAWSPIHPQTALRGVGGHLELWREEGTGVDVDLFGPQNRHRTCEEVLEVILGLNWERNQVGIRFCVW
jgi:hypothetical protein